MEYLPSGARLESRRDALSPDCKRPQGWGIQKMKVQAIAAMAALCVVTSGCASLIGDGSRQDILVTTNPAGATCTFSRHGEQIGVIKDTPGTLTVKRRKYDIDIVCDRPGYAQAKYLNHSGLSAMVGGNIAADLILTAGISSIVDSANGADNEYTSNVVISMVPLGGPIPTRALIVPPQK